MTDNPFAAPNAGDLNYAPASSQNAPGALMAVLIICLVLGILGLLGACIGGGGLAFQSQLSGLQVNNPDPMAQKLQQKIQDIQQPMFIPNLIMIGLNIIVAPLLAAGAIGGLNRKPWGHRLLSIALVLAILYTIVKSIMTIITQVITKASVTSMLQLEMQQEAGPKNAEMMGTLTNVFMMLGIGMVVVWGLILLGFYFWSWNYLRKDSVKSYFGMASPA